MLNYVIRARHSRHLLHMIDYFEAGQKLRKASRGVKSMERTLKVINEEEFLKIKDMINSIRYGNVNVIIQDGKIVQIEKSEKLRFQASAGTGQNKG